MRISNSRNGPHSTNICYISYTFLNIILYELLYGPSSSQFLKLKILVYSCDISKINFKISLTEFADKVVSSCHKLRNFRIAISLQPVDWPVNLVLKLTPIVPEYANYKIYTNNYFSSIPLFV